MNETIIDSLLGKAGMTPNISKEDLKDYTDEQYDYIVNSIYDEIKSMYDNN